MNYIRNYEKRIELRLAIEFLRTWKEVELELKVVPTRLRELEDLGHRLRVLKRLHYQNCQLFLRLLLTSVRTEIWGPILHRSVASKNMPVYVRRWLYNSTGGQSYQARGFPIALSLVLFLTSPSVWVELEDRWSRLGRVVKRHGDPQCGKKKEQLY